MYKLKKIALASAVMLFYSYNVNAAFVAETEPNDEITQAQFIDAANFTTDFDSEITDVSGVNTSTTIPHASIRGTGDDTFDFYAFQGQEGSSIFSGFDIDNGFGPGDNFDSEIALFDASFNVLSINDDIDELFPFPIDPGSVSEFDSFIEVVLPTTGLYFIGVGSFTEDGIAPVPAGAGYTLHISSGSAISPSPVPVPAAIWLLGSSLLALLGVLKKKT